MRWMIPTALAVLFVAASPARAQDERFSVIAGETRVGHLVASTSANRVEIDFDYKNNGRGPTLAESLEFGAAGLPVAWTVSGSTTFGSKVDERFEWAADKATWRDSTGPGEAATDLPKLYISQSASPWALGLYARLLLADGDRTLPTLPAGQVSLAAGDTLLVGEGDTRIDVRTYTLSGLDLNPDYVLLDARNQLFAYASPGLVVVREGYESEAPRLRKLAADLGAARLESIQRETAKTFDGPLRFRNVRLFDPTARALTEPVSVVVHAGQIAGVQPVDAPVTPGETVVEGEGGTLVPGLYEMHSHTSQDGAILNLAAGITSVRDMGNDQDRLAALIRRIEAGEIAGPRVHRSGFIEGRSPFSSNNGRLVESEADALDAVRWYAARGFHQVKLYNSMKPEWSVAAAAEAHRLGLRVSGHVPAFSNADAMIEAGYDELTHINQIMLGWVLEDGEDTRTLLRLTALKRLAGLDLDSARVQRTLDLIEENGVAVEPTIAIHENLLLNQDGQVPRGLADVFGHLPVGAQRNARRAWADMSAPGDAEAYSLAYDTLMDTLRKMRERGVLLIPGTDLGGSYHFHRELELFTQLGYSPAEVLKLATLDMARYLGEDQQSGSIERGKRADFFLVPGDPTADLKAIKSIRAVVKDGVLYLPSEIHPHFGIRPFTEAPRLLHPHID
ncbi:amidohydrolase family protein [uncultured Arenimonas sp.]|uniref:amidohydrolase family protein n=1 Tax=uncultured Arenimonas sp. TaxID=546226 RepID=UPI0030D813CF